MQRGRSSSCGCSLSVKVFICVFIVAVSGLICVEVQRRKRAHDHRPPTRKRFKVKNLNQTSVAKSKSTLGFKSKDPIHVCLSTDDTDLRGLVVAIKTTLAHASNPARISFHVITAPDLVDLVTTLLQVHLSGIKLEVRQWRDMEERIRRIIKFTRHSNTKVRQERLHSPLNFMPFFLPDLLSDKTGPGVDTNRIIYLDTDVAVLGDITELMEMDLQGHALATPVDCTRRYLDIFGSRERAENIGADPDACIIQRGIIVADVKRWREQGISESLQHFLEKERMRTEVLWEDNFPPSPWLLAMQGDKVQALDSAWGCGGLGRQMMSYDEGKQVRMDYRLDNLALVKLLVQVDKNLGNMTPWVSMCSRTAKAIHFDGPLKPWLREALSDPAIVMPVCAQPEEWPMRGKPVIPNYTAEIDCESRVFVRCHEIWYAHISRDIDCALKDVDRDWAEDDRMWHNKFRVALKRKKEISEQEDKQKEEQKNNKKDKEEKDKKKEGKKDDSEGETKEEKDLEKAVEEATKQDEKAKEEANEEK